MFRKRLPAPASGSANPFPWFNPADTDTTNRGAPVPFEWWQRRPMGPQTIPQGTPLYLHHRNYSRGADAYSPHMGILPINPLGAGVPSTARMPSISGPGGRYMFGAIWWDAQNIPTSIAANPTVPAEVIAALVQNASIGGVTPL